MKFQLQELANLNLTAVSISLTTLKEELRRVLEPRTATSKRKLQVIEQLSQAGIPVNVMLAPVIPALNDDEIFSIAKQVSEHGARTMHYQIVRLNGPNEAIFTDWVHQNFPDRADKVLNQLKEMHGGSVSSTRFRERMTGGGVLGMNIRRQFELAKKRFSLHESFPKLRTDLFEIPNNQLRLF